MARDKPEKGLQTGIKRGVISLNNPFAEILVTGILNEFKLLVTILLKGKYN